MLSAINYALKFGFYYFDGKLITEEININACCLNFQSHLFKSFLAVEQFLKNNVLGIWNTKTVIIIVQFKAEDCKGDFWTLFMFFLVLKFVLCF